MYASRRCVRPACWRFFFSGTTTARGVYSRPAMKVKGRPCGYISTLRRNKPVRPSEAALATHFIDLRPQFRLLQCKRDLLFGERLEVACAAAVLPARQMTRR